MFKLFSIVLTVTLYYVCTKELHNVPGSDFCFAVGKPKLEVAFVIDQSSLYIQTKFPILRNLVEFIYTKWPGSKVGVTTFSIYPCTYWYEEELCKNRESREEPFPNGTWRPYHKHPEGCYIFQDALSSDPKPILDRINTQNIEYLASGNIISGLAGLYRTIAEPKMKWTRGLNVDENLLRILFIVSDDVTFDGPINAIHTLKLEELKGDGTDSCVKNKNPTTDQVAELMEKDDMALYMLYSDTSFLSGPQVFENWRGQTNYIRNKYNLFTRLNELNSSLYKLEFYSFVKDLKQSKAMPCADPPAYNTLGL